MKTDKTTNPLLQGKLRDVELTVLVDSIRSITSSLDLDEVLGEIMRNALKVIPATDAGYLMLYDVGTERLLVKAPLGFNDNIYNFKVKPGESITGTVFEDGLGLIFNSKEEILKAMDYHHVSKSNFHHIISSANIPEALICVPISIEDKRIGIMITHQWHRKKVLDEHDLLLLQAFAEQAAIAIQNAQYFTEANNRIEKITQLSAQLEERNIQLQKRHKVHETLTTISLENKGLEAIVHEFNLMLNSPVTFFNVIEDKFYLHDPNEIPNFDQFELKKIFLTRRKPIHLKANHPSVKTYYIYPVYNGPVFLGCFLIHVTEEISESDRIALEQGSSILALELIKNQTVTEYFYKKTHEQFLALLNAKNDDHLETLAKEFGLNASTYWFMAIFEIPNYTDLQLLEIKIHHLVLKLKNELPKTETMIYGLQNRVIFFASITESSHFKIFQQKFDVVKEEWDAKDQHSFRAGISSTYKGLHAIKKIYEEANKTLTYLTSRNRLDIIRYENIGLNKLFLNQSPREIQQFIDEVFLPLSYPHEKKSELEETLLTYFESNRSATKTAEKLHIHINTLYQRIRKIEHVLQLDLNDNEDSLKIHLACHLRSTYV